MTFPAQILTCLGTFTDHEAIKAVVAEHGGGLFEVDEEFSVFEADDRMEGAFDASTERYAETMTDDDWDQIENHSAVAYVIAREIPDDQRVAALKTALLLAGELMEKGLVTAMKCDRSGIAHGLEEWKRLANAAKSDDENESKQALFQAWVHKVLNDEDEKLFYSCGMQLFGKSDFILREIEDVDEAVTAVTAAFAMAELGQSSDALSLGDAEMDTELCPEDHPYFNPFGYREITTTA